MCWSWVCKSCRNNKRSENLVVKLSPSADFEAAAYNNRITSYARSEASRSEGW